MFDFTDEEVNTPLFSPVKSPSSKCFSKTAEVKDAHRDPEESSVDSSKSEDLSPVLRVDKRRCVEGSSTTKDKITNEMKEKFRSCTANKPVPFDAALSIPKEVSKKKKNKKVVAKASSKPLPQKIKKVIVTPAELSKRTFYTMDRMQPMTEGIIDDEVGCNDWFRDLAHRQVTLSFYS